MSMPKHVSCFKSITNDIAQVFYMFFRELPFLWLQVNGKKSMESQTRLMSWYWKTDLKDKDLITYNSHPWIIFPFNWLVIIWRGRRVCLQFDVQPQGRWTIFHWSQYVYLPFHVICCYIRYLLNICFFCFVIL